MVSGIIVDGIVFLMILVNAFIGYKRGLVRVVFQICSTIIAIILVLFLYKPVTNYVIQNTEISKKIQNTLEEKLQEVFEKENVQTPEQGAQNETLGPILQVFIGDDLQHLVEDTTDHLIKNMAIQITHRIISILVFFALFTTIRLLLLLFRNAVDVIANLPVIHLLNASGGMIYGIIKSFLIIYTIFAIISLILPNISQTAFIQAIENAPIASKMFHHNVILNVIFKFL